MTEPIAPLTELAPWKALAAHYQYDPNICLTSRKYGGGEA
jgi:hypothetical protein